MKLKLADKSIYHIGVIKFFDSTKGFGYIAYNDRNLPEPDCYKDIYVNRDSFIDNDACHDSKIVAFQIARQEDGRRIAANVRLLTASEEDMTLRLSYYGAHEKVELKKGYTSNFYNNLRISRERGLKHVYSIITNDATRSPHTTFQHFKEYITHFEVKLSKARYIFDRDYSRNERSSWEEFIENLEVDEIIEILNYFPTVSAYVTDQGIMHDWIENLNLNKVGIVLSSAKDVIYNLSEEIRDWAIGKFEDFLETVIIETLKSEGSSKSTADFLGRPKKTLLGHCLILTTRSYDEVIAVYRAQEKINEFKNNLTDLIASPTTISLRSSLIKRFNAYEEKHQIFSENKPLILSLIDGYIRANNPFAALELLEPFADYLEDELEKIYNRLTPIVKEELNSMLLKATSDSSSIEGFIKSYMLWASQRHNEEIEAPLKNIIHNTTCIKTLAACSLHTNLLTNEEAITLAGRIIDTWSIVEIISFIRKCQKSPRSKEKEEAIFLDICIEKALNRIMGTNVRTPFDGDEYDTIRKNCDYLDVVYDNLSTEEHYELWDKYIESQSLEDLMILYKKGVISELPEVYLESIINSINYDGIVGDVTSWYEMPRLRNKSIQEIIESTDEDLFEIVSKRLRSLDLTDENLGLALFLICILNANKPKDLEYLEEKEWERKFKSQLDKFHKESSANTRLLVLLWVVLNTPCKGGMPILSDIFAHFPPFIQIRVIKKFFSYISQGKISHTATSLYNYITNGGKNQICLCLEIAFSYLKLKEEDKNAIFNNARMLQILDGRDDHDNWDYVILLMHKCCNRWSIDNEESYYERYYNGQIDKFPDGSLRLYVPYKMIDKNGNIKKYNNKYYHTINDVISLSYETGTYSTNQSASGVVYVFGQEYEMELLTLARSFNIKDYGIEIQYVDSREEESDFCECRLSSKLDNKYGKIFHWCSNKPCYRPPIRYMADSEWENYTILDFMRILGIPTDCISLSGKPIKYGHYITLSSYFKAFTKFYGHLKCRDCGKLMKPKKLSNYASSVLIEFHCVNERCEKHHQTVYLNHCFNKSKCKQIIDSRDSKKCPNGQYICPDCGGCCSTENFRIKLDGLRATGGVISPKLESFVAEEKGHWEKNEFFCYKCGRPMTLSANGASCKYCNVTYKNLK